MNEETAGRELAAQFHRLMEHEPRFRTDLGEALRAAEQSGRRRRTKTYAVRGAATVLAIAASTALMIAWPDNPTSMAPPVVAVPTEATPTEVTPTQLTPTFQALDPIDRLEILVREIARPSGGVVKVQRRDAALKEVVASAKSRDGMFEVAADVSSDNSDIRTGQEMCQSEGFSCTELSSTPTVAVWAREDPDKPGHETLELTAKARDGEWLSVQVDNDVEMLGGSEAVGLNWNDAGITVSSLRKAVMGSGLSMQSN